MQQSTTTTTFISCSILLLIMKLYRSGKVKDVYEANDRSLEFVYTDRISVFDKMIPGEIPFKGETLCRTSVFWFQILRDMGVKSHFQEFIPPNRVRVRKVDVISDYSKLNTETTNYLIPLEFIMRHYVAGSMHRKLQKGEVKPEELGFPAGMDVPYGAELPEPYFEMTTKLEEIDRPLTEAEALEISGLTNDELENIRNTIERIDRRMSKEVERRDLIHVDGKKEFGFDGRRRPILVDSFGTADEDRFWDSDMYAKGEFVELSKESVRKYYKDSGYYERLMAAREEGEDLEIPPLPENVVKETSHLYITVFERITGETFREQ